MREKKEKMHQNWKEESWGGKFKESWSKIDVFMLCWKLDFLVGTPLGCCQNVDTLVKRVVFSFFLHIWSVCVLCAMVSSQPRGVLTLKKSKKRMQQWNGDGKSNKLQILWSLLGHKRSWLGLILKKSLNILLDMAFLLIKVRILDSKERSAGFV